MSDTPENEVAEELDGAEPSDDQIDPAFPAPGPAVENEALSGGPKCSLGLSLLTLVLLLAFLGLKSLLRADHQGDPLVVVAWAALMALSLVVAIPSWMASNVYALGSLVTGQRQTGFSLLALLLNATSAIVFLLVE